MTPSRHNPRYDTVITRLFSSETIKFFFFFSKKFIKRNPSISAIISRFRGRTGHANRTWGFRTTGTDNGVLGFNFRSVLFLFYFRYYLSFNRSPGAPPGPTHARVCIPRPERRIINTARRARAKDGSSTNFLRERTDADVHVVYTTHVPAHTISSAARIVPSRSRGLMNNVKKKINKGFSCGNGIYRTHAYDAKPACRTVIIVRATRVPPTYTQRQCARVLFSRRFCFTSTRRFRLRPAWDVRVRTQWDPRRILIVIVETTITDAPSNAGRATDPTVHDRVRCYRLYPAVSR